MNKKTLMTLLFVGFSIASPVLANDDQSLLNSFHQYGITKCDSFILEHSKLKDNWNFFIGKHLGGIDGTATEVSITEIFGSKNDTVKTDSSYIQTAKKCFLRQTWTTTFPGTCSDNIDGDLWYIVTKMPNKDYTKYENRSRVELFAKDISMGNFKSCVQEGSLRISGNHG
ncbi:hypothetical protein [Photobacterium carnosum]|uniref:hypothetical protein n=1 Tax=Photobacterium carnosum TaxID=2023717 RepID=UPI001E5F8F13|nr:hypothetical protein [Photobacterium carnosum]MCD9496882.1 hypothetical protein [Photobacterium carnosum]